MNEYKLRRRSTALPIIKGIADGAANFVGGIQNAQRLRAENARRQADLELRQAQVQMQRDLMEKRYGPVKVNLGMLQMLDSMDNGDNIPSSVQNRVWNNFVDSAANAPELIPQITAAATSYREKQKKAPFGPLTKELAESPDLTLQSEGMTINQTPPPRQRPPMSGELTVDRGTFDLYKSGRNAKIQAQVAAGRNANQLEIAKMNSLDKREVQQLINEGKADLQRLVNEGNAYVQELRNKGLIGAQKIRSAGKSTSASPQNLDLKSINKQIETFQKQKGELRKANSLTGVPPSPEMVAASERYYDEQIALLNEKKSKLPAASTGAAPAGKKSVPPSGLSKRWDPAKEPGRINEFKKGDIVDVVGKGRIKITSDQGDFEMVGQ